MDDVGTKIIEILKKHMKEPRDDISLSTPLTDLKIESLDLAMIVVEIARHNIVEITVLDRRFVAVEFGEFPRVALQRHPRRDRADTDEKECLVVSSVNSTESFGLVQVEAMLSGTPVVATELPGVREPVRMTGMGEASATAT